jgi:flagellar hook protein FlgE
LPAFPVSINLDKVTQYGSSFAVATQSQDGYAAGELTSVNIEDSGMVMATYSNGVTRAEAQLALANFRNPQGLRLIGGNNWVETFESGAPVVGTPGTGSLGALRSGALEDSNVDLTAELVNLMTAQRYYQANAQTIKTQDQVMSTLVNLR